MKNYIYILSIMLFSSILAACSDDTVAISNIIQETQMNQEEKVQSVMTEGKEKKDIDFLKEKSHYQFEAKDGESAYKVFLFAEDEVRNSSGKDQLFSGRYSVYLAEKDATDAYKQDVLQDMGPLTFQFSAEQVYPLNLGNKTIIVILQAKDNGRSTPLLLAVNDGEVKVIQSEDVIPSIYGNEIKAINQKYLQIIQSLDKNKWKYITLTFNSEEFRLETLDETIVSPKNWGDQSGKYWYSLWSEKKENYFPFQNLELNSDLIEKAKQGIPLGTPYPIGTNISNIKAADPHFMEEGTFEATPFVMYPEITYLYNEASGIVTAVSIPGERIKTTRNEIIQLFGNPVKEEGLEYAGEKKLVYLADKYAIEFMIDKEGKVLRLHLRKL